jgi:hypothetical protein
MEEMMLNTMVEGEDAHQRMDEMMLNTMDGGEDAQNYG